jgi:hypothetical protein
LRWKPQARMGTPPPCFICETVTGSFRSNHDSSLQSL